MAKAVFHTTIIDTTTGLPVPNATVGIIDATSGLYAPLWSDRDGTVTVSPNPTTADANGFIEVYVTPGRFRIEADDGSGGTQTWENELLGIVEEPYLSVTTVEASASATVDFLSSFDGAGVYNLSCLAGTVANDGDTLRLRVSTDGSTVESGASDYQYSASNTTSGSAADSAFIAFAVGNDVSETFSLSMEIVVDSDGQIVFSAKSIAEGTGGLPGGVGYTGRYIGTGVTGIQIYASTGNIATGTFTLRKIG